ncbi:hypothetical protein ES703_55912 [subsurface metagenome]
MNDKCCRLIYLFPQWKIDNVFVVHPGIGYWSNPSNDLDNPEPEHGWLMDKPEEGYPCDHLTPDGCQFVLDGGKKPFRCQRFPIDERELALIDTCGFTFKDGIRQGSCNECKG